jgi:hypothetical protein
VRQAGTEEIAFVIDEDLRLVFETPKSRRMHDPVAVALGTRCDTTASYPGSDGPAS